MLVPTAAATPRAGLLRIALAVVVVLLASMAWPPWDVRGVYLVAVLAVAFGSLSVTGWPQILLRDRLARVVADSAIVGLLIAYTGGGGSPFFPLFFLAALGIISIEARARAVAAAAVVVGAYAAAAVFAAGLAALGTGVIIKAGLLALFCAVVGFMGYGMQVLRKLALGLSSTLANEIDRVEKDESLISKFGPVLKVLSLEETLRWAAETAQTVGGGTYAHVATLNGNHATVLRGDFDVCPSWWHPSIQRLLLWSCREGEAVRSEEEVHGIRGFLAIPVGSEGDERRGAVIVGGKEFGAEEERALRLLAEGLGSAIENAEDAPGGLDQLTGLPNRTSLYRVLWRELSHGRGLTVLLMDLDRFGEYNLAYGLAAGDTLLRRIGGKLREGRQRAFRYGNDEFAVVLLGGSDEGRTRRVAGGVRQLVAEPGNLRPMKAAVGFALAEAGHTDPGAVLSTALRALEEAKGRTDGVMGLTVGERSAQDRPTEGSVEEFAESLVGALEAKDPEIERHLRAVSRLASLIGRRISLSKEQMQALIVGGLLHDVGKIGVPDTVLHKPGRLTAEEYEVMKGHPVLGVEIVSPVKELAVVLPVINHHHERFDGTGYPDGLRGEDIPLVARVISVVDVFDSMIHDRPYGYGMSQEAALKEVEHNSGTQFDPRIVRTLREVVEEADDGRVDSAG
jgi:diguanylate cyclase (GGDEF)-like protein/putative nucleotidyltransferase with HDIG domain